MERIVASSSTTRIVLLSFRYGVVAMRSETAIYWPRHGSVQSQQDSVESYRSFRDDLKHTGAASFTLDSTSKRGHVCEGRRNGTTFGAGRVPLNQFGSFAELDQSPPAAERRGPEVHGRGGSTALYSRFVRFRHPKAHADCKVHLPT
jgi:hypothetical protein